MNIYSFTVEIYLNISRIRWLDKINGLCRGDDFPFQKSAFSVWENSEFRFKGLPKWKFRLAIDNVHLKKHEFHFA